MAEKRIREKVSNAVDYEIFKDSFFKQKKELHEKP